MKIQPQTGLPCDTIIWNVRFDGQRDVKISERLKILFDEDQRYVSEPVDWTDPESLLNQLGQDFIKQREEEGLQHRVEVLQWLQQGKITLAPDLYFAAMIYQHGTCADHFKLANELAGRSINLGYPPARWLYAASRDRYLLSINRAQQFGTQLHWDKNRGWYMPALDFHTTDEDRAKYDVPPIAELWERLRNFRNRKENIRTKWQRFYYELQAWFSRKTAQ